MRLLQRTLSRKRKTERYRCGRPINRRRVSTCLKPSSVYIFLAIVVAWIVVATVPAWESFPGRTTARLAGYVAFAAMLVPYLHIVRRMFRTRRGLAMTFWLRLHIAAAYVAFAMVLIHSRGRASSPVTLVLLWLTWIVMISGVVGYYGQKLLYFLLPRLVSQRGRPGASGAAAALAAGDGRSNPQEERDAGLRRSHSAFLHHRGGACSGCAFFAAPLVCQARRRGRGRFGELAPSRPHLRRRQTEGLFARAVAGRPNQARPRRRIRRTPGRPHCGCSCTGRRRGRCWF